MKYTYHFANGDSQEIEVTEAQYLILKDADRIEYNNDHTNTRRHISLDMAESDEGMQFSDITQDVEAAVCAHESIIALYNAMRSLSPEQRQLIQKVYADGYSYAEIAREEGVDRSAVRKRMERIHANLKKILK